MCASLDPSPVARYHTLVVPRRHFENIFDAPADLLGTLMRAVKHLAELYRKRIGIENVQVWNASGQVVGQDHRVPRFPGDDSQSGIPHPESRSDFSSRLEKVISSHPEGPGISVQGEGDPPLPADRETGRARR